MSPVLLRSTGSLYLRDAGDGRTVHGLAVPYGVTAEVSDGYGTYLEEFAPGAFARSIQQRGSKVKLFTQHETRRFPIGRAVHLEERPDGLHAAFHVSDTRDGNEALELIRDGVVDAFSIGFAPVHQKRRGDVTVRTEAALREVSLVHTPAYEGALVAGVRSAPTLTADAARRRLAILRSK